MVLYGYPLQSTRDRQYFCSNVPAELKLDKELTIVCDDFNTIILPDTNTRVCGTEIDSNGFAQGRHLFSAVFWMWGIWEEISKGY